MARTLKDARLDTRAARRRLRQRREPHWRSLSEGLAIGYRKGAKGGTWIARHYSSEHGRRYQSIGTADDVVEADGVHVLSYEQAQKQAREWFAKLALQDRGAAQPGPLTVKDAIEDYLKWLERHGKGAKDSRYKAEALILPALGDLDCDSLTTEQIEKWFHDLSNSEARLRTRRNAPKRNTRKLDKTDVDAVRRRRASANRTWTILRAALNRAWRRKKIASDDAWRRVEPFEDVDAARVRYLSIVEAQRLVNACRSEFRRLVQAALASGARYGELAALKISDFNADNGSVHIQRSKSGKGRHIVLNAEGVALFKSLSTGRDGDALLLPRSDGAAWKPAQQRRPMTDACKHGKITPTMSFHGLRHTYASHSVMNGVPLMVVAKNLGHRDTRMVERHYGHLAPNYIVDEIRKNAPTFKFEIEKTTASLDDRRGISGA
jgi:integrase